MTSAPYTTVGKKQEIEIEMIFIGKGASSKVFSGRYDDRNVAVKRVDKNEYSKKELELLRLFDDKNIVKYFFKDFDHEYMYIVMEKCDCTLQKFIEDASSEEKKYISRIDILRQTTDGLQYLHDIENIIHRDLKPSNVLLLLKYQKWVVRIADFGISKQLPSDSSKITQTDRKGAVGYNAPEVLNIKEKLSKKSDIFSLGILYYFTLSGGKHPYGTDMLKMEAGIRDGEQPTMELLDKKFADDAKCLILSMIAHKCEDRFDITQVQSHHLFWNNEKKLVFIQDVSDYSIAKTTSKIISTKLNGNSEPIIGKSWRASVYAESPVIKKVLEEMPGKNKSDDIMSLLRNIRNLKHHFGEKPTEFKNLMANGDSVNNGEFFFNIFPALISHVYEVMRSVERENPIFKNFFYVKKEPRPGSPVQQISSKQVLTRTTADESSATTSKAITEPSITEKVLTGTTADEILSSTSKAITELSITEKVNAIIMFNRIDEHMYSFNLSTKESSRMQVYPVWNSSILFTTVVSGKHLYFMQNQKVHQLEYSDSAAKWKEMSSMKEDHGWDPPAVMLNGFIYVCGSSGSADASRSVERYDAAQNQWDRMCDMNTARKYHCFVATEDHIYCIGGRDKQYDQLQSVEIFDERFDERLNKWEFVKSAPRQIWMANGAVVKNRIYVTTDPIYKVVVCYDIQNNSWSEIDPPIQWPFSRSGAIKILAVDDELYIIGIIRDSKGKSKDAIYLLEPETKQINLIEEFEDKNINRHACLAVKL